MKKYLSRPNLTGYVGLEKTTLLVYIEGFYNIKRLHGCLHQLKRRLFILKVFKCLLFFLSTLLISFKK
ncbi:hypothetical protein A5810_000763 [Enterococcus faecium]|uniref:Uncharacterized protein n=1 Tax=Enterococcus faecium TaxID=1352 RepID=A0A242BH77_ENTFC|nr:hypothetical protein A5810_000763 [Enterococcus faecium]